MSTSGDVQYCTPEKSSLFLTLLDSLLPDGQRIEESARTAQHTEAENLLKLREDDVATGVPLSATIGRLRFADAAADLLIDCKVNGKGWSRTTSDERLSGI